MKIRVGILCSDGHHHKYLQCEILKNFELSFVVIESSSKQTSKLLERKKYFDYMMSKYNDKRRSFFGHSSRRKRAFRTHNFSLDRKRVLEVDSINNEKCLEFVSSFEVDYVIVMGTSIIKRELLKEIEGKAINIHGGYLPNYKGNHCIYFAMYNGDYEKVGSTIHFVDAGVDTGLIIKRVTTKVKPGDSPESIYNRSEKMAIHALIDLLKSKVVKALPEEPEEGPGSIYRTRDRTPIKDCIFFMKKCIRFIRRENRGRQA